MVKDSKAVFLWADLKIQSLASSEANRLTAWARPSDHEKIKTTLEQIDIEGREDAEAVVYALEGIDTAGVWAARLFLSSAVPGARLYVQAVLEL